MKLFFCSVLICLYFIEAIAVVFKSKPLQRVSQRISSVHQLQASIGNVNDDVDRKSNRLLRSIVCACVGSLMSINIPAILNVPGGSIPPVHAAAYLKEPTSDFQDELKKTAAFEAGQKKIRAEWDGVVKKLTESATAEDKEENIKKLTAILVRTENIPEGVKKQPLVKTIRTLKFVDPGSRKKTLLPSWSKNTEIAYQAFVLEFNKHLVPDNRPAKEI